MKNKFLITGIIGLISTAAFAQKNELATAKKEFGTYETARNQKLLAATANTSLNTAKASIDKAAANEKTATLPETYALKALIYGGLSYRDTVPATSAPFYTTGVEALKKAKETDTKGEQKEVIKQAEQYLGIYSLNKGVREYSTKQYDDAYKSFDFYRSLNPEDTTAIYYTGLAAINMKNYPSAIDHFKKLTTTKFSKNQTVYSDLSNIYLENKDTTNALSILNEAVTKFPNNADLRSREIEIALQQGKATEIVEKINSAITNDPKNKALYYYSGIAYQGIAGAEDKKIASTKDAAAKAASLKIKSENNAKAVAMFKKAVELDPNFKSAVVSLSDALMAPIADEYNAANKLPASKQKEYVAAIAKVNAQADAIKPDLLKAVELDPKSISALTNLRNYYIIKKDNVKATELSNKIKAL
jgi:Flp pilus assembly protein TadD